MKLIHCSDIHLDSPMDSCLPPEKARQRGREICRTFCRMADYARENGVTGVLICGDLFDGRAVSPVTVSEVLSAIQKAPRVQFFYLRGNHDEGSGAFSGTELPPNLHLFDDTWTQYRLGEVILSGIEPEGEGWTSLYDTLPLREEDTNLVMLHGQVSSQKGEELLCLPALRELPIRYLALGHLHGYRREKLSPRGEWCYAGALEGRGFDECGEHGFVLLDIENGTVTPSFVPFAARQLHSVEVDISGLETYPDILARCDDVCQGISSEDLVKLKLAGPCPPEAQTDARRLLEALEGQFFFLRVEDGTTPAVDKEALAGDISLKSAFTRRVLACEELTDEEKRRVLHFGINALYGRDVTA